MEKLGRRQCFYAIAGTAYWEIETVVGWFSDENAIALSLATGLMGFCFWRLLVGEGGGGSLLVYLEEQIYNLYRLGRNIYMLVDMTLCHVCEQKV